MSSVKIPRLYLVQNSIVMRAVEQFLNISGLKVEFTAARQWYEDIYHASQDASNLVNPLAAQSKELTEQINKHNTAGTAISEELQKDADEANAALTDAIQAQVPLNIVTLHVSTVTSKPSIADMLCLQQLHEFQLINCDAFDEK